MIAAGLRRLKHQYRQRRALAEIAGRSGYAGAAHGLPAPLVVSLTSYPARFGTLLPTLQSILRQSVRPSRVILWLDEGDDALLPDQVRALTKAGLEISICPNWRSYKKIIPTLLDCPGAFIVTADDDVYYPYDWLAGLVGAVRDGARIACYRAHHISLGPDGLPQEYAHWHRNICKPASGPLVFLTGVMGVIYSPGVFHPDVTRSAIFTEHCPATDDVWLYWMHRLAGTEAQKIDGRSRIIEWEGSQTQNLRSGNLAGDGNDRAVRNLIGNYGWPG